MLPHDRAQPAAQDKPSWPTRIMRWVAKAPLIIKVLLVAAALVLWPLVLPFTLLSSAVAVAQKRPGRAAAYATATWVFARVTSNVPDTPAWSWAWARERTSAAMPESACRAVTEAWARAARK